MRGPKLWVVLFVIFDSWPFIKQKAEKWKVLFLVTKRGQDSIRQDFLICDPHIVGSLIFYFCLEMTRSVLKSVTYERISWSVGTFVSLFFNKSQYGIFNRNFIIIFEKYLIGNLFIIFSQKQSNSSYKRKFLTMVIRTFSKVFKLQ